MRYYMLASVCSLSLAYGLFSFMSPVTQGVAPAAIPMFSYQHAITRIDGRDCPSWPTCSAYATSAIHRHGIIIGSWLMLDRLIHEHDDLRTAPRVLVDGEMRVYDPLQRNNQWLNSMFKFFTQF